MVSEIVAPPEKALKVLEILPEKQGHIVGGRHDRILTECPMEIRTVMYIFSSEASSAQQSALLV